MYVTQVLKRSPTTFLRLVRSTLPGIALLAVACSSAVRSERDWRYPAPRGTTWAWRSGAQARAPESVAARLTLAFESALRARGLSRTDDTVHADVLLSLAITNPGSVQLPHEQVAEVSKTATYTTVCAGDNPRSGIPPVSNGCGDRLESLTPVYDRSLVGPEYATCRAPWESCVVINMWRRDSGVHVWHATYPLDAAAMGNMRPRAAQRVADEVVKTL